MRRMKRALILVVPPLLAFFGVLAVVPPSRAKPDWTAAAGTPTPSSFCYAMFPARPDVPLYDTPNGVVVGTLSRAMVNSQEELDAGGQVELVDRTATSWVKVDDLRFEKPSDAMEVDFAAFDVEYRAKAPNGFRHASLAFTTQQLGSTRFTLRLTDDDNYEVYVYDVIAGKPHAMEMYRVFGPGLALQDLVRLFWAVLAAAGVAIIIRCVIVIVWWRQIANRGPV